MPLSIMITLFSIIFCPNDVIDKFTRERFFKKCEMFIAKNAKFFLDHYLRCLPVGTIHVSRVNVERKFSCFSPNRKII